MEKFDFAAEHILQNDVVLLRPLKQEDIEGFLNYSLNEPDIWSFNANGANGEENLLKYVNHALQQRAREREYPFAVIDKKSGALVGSTRLYDILHDRKTIQLGFTWYGKKYQASGINKNCKYLLLDFAFNELGVERVGFAANSLNARSIAAMKSIGCTVEGVMRSSGYDAAGNRIDSTILSILRTEWEAELASRLKNKIALK